MVRETWVRSQVESYQRLKKWYLMPPCLTLSIIRYGSRVKWSNPGKWVAPSPTPWCSKLSKRETSGHPRLRSPTLLYHELIFDKSLLHLCEKVSQPLLKILHKFCVSKQYINYINKIYKQKSLFFFVAANWIKFSFNLAATKFQKTMHIIHKKMLFPEFCSQS